MANLPPLPKVASTGSSDPQPRPESYNNRPCTGRGCSSVNSSSLSRASARLALRLRQINEERAIQQREIEMERRAFAFERKVLNEKYRLLEQQIQRKSTFKEPSADGIQLSTSPHTADNSTIPKKLKIPSIQSIGIESLTDRLKSLGTQQRISSAFPKADSMTQNMSASSSVRCNMENFIARAPYGTPSNSEFNYEDTAVRSHQPCHGTVQHQRQVCISSQGSSCVRKFSQNTRRNSITNTKDLRTTRKIKPIFCQGQQRIVIKLPLLQLHQYVKSHMECSIVCVQKELTVIERAQNDYRSALSETRVCRIPSYLDTGQKLKNRTQSRMKNVETKSSLFSTKKTDLLIAVMHGSSMLWYVFVECQNAMITRLLSNAPLSNLVKLSILRALPVYTTAEQLCGQQKLYTMISTQHGSDYARAEQIIVFVVAVLVVDVGISRGSRKKEICKFFKMGIYRYGSVCSNTHVAPATEQTQSGLSFAADSGPSFTIDPLKRINASEFVFKFNQWQSPTGSVEVQQTEQMLPEERLVSLDLSEEGVVADDEAEEEDAIAAAGMPYAVVITISVGMIGIHVDSVLCPYFESRGVCMMDTCPYVAIYKRCDKFCLNALDKEHQGLHDVECIKQHELDMQQSFTIHRSKDKICDIYLKVVMEKLCREQRFGILPNFSNIFYLKCIWTLRQAKHSKNNIKLGCRTCRIPSHFVCLSIVWVGSREEKDEPINDNMMACNITHCKHFKQDSSKCLFGNKCFYVLVDVGGPSRQTDNRLQISHLGDDSAMSELYDHNTHAESILRSYDSGEVEYLYKAIGTLTRYWDKLVRQLDIRDKYWIGKYEQSNGKVYSMSCIDEEREVATSERKVLTRAIQCFPNKERYMDRVGEECSDRDPEVKKMKFGYKYHRSKENNIELIYPINAISVFNICTTGGSDDYGNALGGQAASRRLFGMKPTGNHRKRYVRNCDDDDNRGKQSNVNEPSASATCKLVGISLGKTGSTSIETSDQCYGGEYVTAGNTASALGGTELLAMTRADSALLLAEAKL